MADQREEQLRHTDKDSLAGQVNCTLLATDLQRSVLHVVTGAQHQPLAYSPYGHRAPESGLASLLGFNGERREPMTGHYLLGNGYRAFNPALMRFNSPDSLSPFGKGGVNAYAYCVGDPVNLIDPTGTFAIFARAVHSLISRSMSVGQRASRKVSDLLSATANAPTQARAASALDYQADTRRLRTIGYEFKQLSRTAELPPIARFAKSKGYTEAQLFAQKGYLDNPGVQAQYRHAKDPEVLSWVSQKDKQLGKATDELILKYPERKLEIEALATHIRSR